MAAKEDDVKDVLAQIDQARIGVENAGNAGRALLPGIDALFTAVKGDLPGDVGGSKSGAWKDLSDTDKGAASA